MPDVRVLACRAQPDYRLWLRFDDGLNGSVYLGDLLDIGTFTFWRDPKQFARVHVDVTLNAIVWDAGVRLDPEVLYEDLAARGCKRAEPPEHDPAFQRFLQAALVPVRKRKRRGRGAA